MIEFIYALVSVIIVSLISLIGVFTLSIKIKSLKKFLLFLVAFSAGTLLAASFLHMIPESVEELGSESLLYVLVGIILFLIIESFVHWHHCLKDQCHVYTKKSMGMMNLIGDSIHNFSDGVIIAAAYLTSIPLGIAATIAILFHEIPQELGDFAVLIHSGFSTKKALFYNFLSALTAVLGMLIGFFFLQSFSFYLPYIVAIAAGGFIYIALADLFPEINKNRDLKNLVIQTCSVLIGIILIFSIITALPHATHNHTEEDNHHDHEDETEFEQESELLEKVSTPLFSLIS